MAGGAGSALSTSSPLCRPVLMCGPQNLWQCLQPHWFRSLARIWHCLERALSTPSPSACAAPRQGRHPHRRLQPRHRDAQDSGRSEGGGRPAQGALRAGGLRSRQRGALPAAPFRPGWGAPAGEDRAGREWGGAPQRTGPARTLDAPCSGGGPSGPHRTRSGSGLLREAVKGRNGCPAASRLVDSPRLRRLGTRRPLQPSRSSVDGFAGRRRQRATAPFAVFFADDSAIVGRVGDGESEDKNGQAVRPRPTGTASIMVVPSTVTTVYIYVCARGEDGKRGQPRGGQCSPAGPVNFSPRMEAQVNPRTRDLHLHSTVCLKPFA